MKMTVVDRGKRFEVHLLFPDCRSVDLEIALYRSSQEKRWEVSTEKGGIGERVYRVSSLGSFLAAARFTHGFEAPTRAIFENKPPDSESDYWPAARGATNDVAREFLKECAARGLITERSRDKALAELDKHRDKAA